MTQVPVHIAAYRGKSLMSCAIRAFNWGPYSHVSWLTEDGTEVESWSKGVTETPGLGANHTPGTVVDLFTVLPLLRKPTCRGMVDAAIRSNVGKRYDHLGILGFVFRSPALQRDARFFCSELVFEGLQDCGVHLLERIPAYKVSPTLLTLSPMLALQGSQEIMPHV